MAERSLRGMSIGAKSLESDDNVDFAAANRRRIRVSERPSYDSAVR